ncbi:MAG: response regulator transcription factor [Spirochaetia bacterium]|nr:response regulator transcription factor [Spirochaetia bacterium]
MAGIRVDSRASLTEMAGPSMYNVLLVDDHPPVRAGIRAMLADAPEFAVIGEASSSETALGKIRMNRVDLVLLDISMPPGDCFDVIPLIREAKPDTKIVLLSMHRDWAFLEKAISLGVKGYLNKDADASDIISALRNVMKGGSAFPGSVTETSTYDPVPENLSARELEILQMIGEGLLSREIAERMNLSLRTIEFHRANVMQKLGLRKGIDLVKVAIGISKKKAR